MKATFQERLTFAIAVLVKRLERWQGTRVEKAKALVEKRKADHLDIALIGADAFTDYRLMKRDRYNQIIEKARVRFNDEFKRAVALKKQADSIHTDAMNAYHDTRQEYEDKIEAIYKEQLE